MSLKNVPMILCFIVCVNHVQAAEPQAKPDVQPGNTEDGKPPTANARIKLVSADENNERKSYRWEVIRDTPLKVIQGWYWFDEVGIREHGGGGRQVAETRLMQLSLLISKEDDYLALKRSYAFSSDFGHQRADVTIKTQWPDSTELKTYYLHGGYLGLTDKLQPLWKGEFIRDEKVVKTVIYAARVVGPDVPNNLFDVNDTSEALRIGREWRPVSDAIWRLLRLRLPDIACDAHYAEFPNLAGIVFWMRFDLPRRDFEACLDRTPKLPAYARFTEDAALKEYLYSGYRTGAPEWWRPWDLSEGIYALRRTNTKELSDIAVGIGRLEGENIRVYIGAFSPW